MSKNLSTILRAGSVTNVVGGTAGQVHYQSATDTTAFVTNDPSGNKTKPAIPYDNALSIV